MAPAFFAALMAIALTSAPSANGAKTDSKDMVGVALRASGQVTKVHETFDAFAEHHGRSYKQGSDEYAMRMSLFEKRQNEMLEHNAKDGQSYKVTLNHFSDLTDHERKQYLGLRHGHSKKAAAPASMLETSQTKRKSNTDEACNEDGDCSKSTDFCFSVNADVANSGSCKADPGPTSAKDWRVLSVANNVANQGSCGSCWAVTSAALLEAHYEIQRVDSDSTGQTQTKQFSAQELVNCVQNLQECGGAGGCEGATVELAMDHVRQYGLHTEAEYPYTGSDGQCVQAGALADGLGGGLGGVTLGMVTGHTTLPTNKVKDLMYAMYTFGPVALSVAANDWFSYNDGEFDGCDQTKSMIIDHAVLGYGYNASSWTIRNSWGADWGMNGFIFMKRPTNEESFCSTDDDPAKGVGCKNGPASVQVCGMCGILMDSVYPHFSVLQATSSSQETGATGVLPVGSTAGASSGNTQLMQDEQAVTVDGAAVIRMEPI